MADKGGMDCVALGSDFDGIGSHLEGDSPRRSRMVVKSYFMAKILLSVYFFFEERSLHRLVHDPQDGFYDVAKLCRKPFVATHSNCRALSPHQRNLTDEMLKILGDVRDMARTPMS